MDLKNMFLKLKEGTENKGKKNIGNLLILLLFGVLLLIVGTSLSGTSKMFSTSSDKSSVNTSSQVTVLDKNENNIEIELKNTIGKMEGVGKVEVMMYFESGAEQVPAFNVTDSTSTSKETDTVGGKRDTTQKNTGSTVVLSNDGGKSEPFIIKTFKPKVTGVFVVAEGAENKVVAYKIAKAVVDLFNVPENKVNVYPMKK